MTSLDVSPRPQYNLTASKFSNAGADTDRVRITNDSVNFSQSNRKFSFGVGERFKKTKQTAAGDLIGYDLPSTLGGKKCSMGVGQRFQTPELIRHRLGDRK